MVLYSSIRQIEGRKIEARELHWQLQAPSTKMRLRCAVLLHEETAYESYMNPEPGFQSGPGGAVDAD